MRAIDRILLGIKNPELGQDSVNRLIYLAYMLGREEATKEVSDKYSAILKSQHKRAEQCRYHQMAEGIIGFRGDHLDFPDYSQDVSTELAPYYETNIE